MSSQLSTSSPQIASEVIWRELDDNAVLVSPGSGKVRVLNHIGTLIWRMLTENHSISDIVTHLTTHFDVTPTQARQDVILFLQELHNRGLLQTSGAADIELGQS
jgi:hypothetical protein